MKDLNIKIKFPNTVQVYKKEKPFGLGKIKLPNGKWIDVENNIVIIQPIMHEDLSHISIEQQKEIILLRAKSYKALLDHIYSNRANHNVCFTDKPGKKKVKFIDNKLGILKNPLKNKNFSFYIPINTRGFFKKFSKFFFSCLLASAAPVSTEGMRPWVVLKPWDAPRK